MPDGQPVIAYVSQQFPNLTMTFVYREVLALRRLGLKVHTLASWPPQRAELSAEAQDLVKTTFYIFPLNWLRTIGLHVRYAISRPSRYFGALGVVMLFNRESWRNRLRTAGHFFYAVCVADEVERLGADHLHADFALNAATVALVASRLTGRSFSFAAHAADLYVNPILLTEKIRAAAFVVPISEYNRRFLATLAPEKCALKKMRVVHCGLDLNQFAPPEARAPNPRSLLVTVGRLVEKKGLRYLIEACRRLAEQGLAFDCWIVGDGPEKVRLQHQIETHHLQAHVRLLGAQPQEKVRALLARADLFVLPCVVGSDGDQDGIPVALMEAMALSLPVVSTYVSGIPELVDDGVSGLLVEPNNAEALARALANLMADASRAQALGAAGRCKIEREFDSEKCARQLLELFVTRVGQA